MPQLPADNHTSSQQSRTALLAADNKNSVLAEIAGGKPNSIAYSAYGQQTAQEDVATNIGFNGALLEPHLGWYLLGSGYRAYNPTLMRFHSPDSWSPFGGGGLNAYMYCVGDPVNFSDPTGHIKLPKFKFRSTRSPSPPHQLPRTASHPNSYETFPVASSSAARPSNIQQRPLPEPPTERLPPLPPQNSTLGTVSPISNPPPRPPKRNVIPVNSEPLYSNVSISVEPLYSTASNPVEPLYHTISNSSTPSSLISSHRSEYAPVPPTRTLANGASRHYSVTYDANGNPRQKSVQKISLSQLSGAVRNAKK
ncbi:hypothetical protein PS928_01671 [Pseudomonas fluorescens]|uniref:RHS repeat-associated core domain-containing protein n=2 Tax=Pseudomonas TaxID=286 RepID=A0A5E7T6F3_PSEFL|nr:RHS repeat-associated core domain-containing protein [Pseudomonas sp. VI4.1]OPK06275.1 hypothetical protein BZ163_31790 [Pseudomonas sp. VI4.1]VVP91233.1 hypothetical protein PS928_01671 [Pseudomonas fluorescens]